MACKLVCPFTCDDGRRLFIFMGEEQQRAFNSIKVALMEATALAQPDTEGEFVLDTDASGVAISGILHQWQGPPESRNCDRLYSKQKVNLYASKVWSPKTGNVRCILFHLEKPQLSLSTKIHTEGSTIRPYPG